MKELYWINSAFIAVIMMGDRPLSARGFVDFVLHLLLWPMLIVEKLLTLTN